MNLPKEKVFTNPADAFNFVCSRFEEIKEQYSSIMLDITRFYSREEDNPNCYEALSITFFEMKGYAVTGAIETIILNHPLKAHEFNSEQFDHWGTSESPFMPIVGTAGDLDWIRSTRWIMPMPSF